MPLLVICGIPGSGKTTRALALKNFIEETHGREAVIVNEENLNLEKNQFYSGNDGCLISDMIQEKSCRGFLRSNVEKSLNDQTVVILDSLNYIKGFRYELFVLARNAKSTHAVVRTCLEGYMITLKMFCNTSFE